MSRILFLSELLPYPLASGAKIRAYYVLRQLALRHDVTLLSFVREDDQPEHIAHLGRFLHQVQTVPMQRSWTRNARAALQSLFTGRPAIIHREELRSMRQQVQATLDAERFDVVHADQIPMAQYGLMGGPGKVKRLLDQHNATFQIIDRLANSEGAAWKRLLLRREAKAFARYEVDVCRRYDHVSFVTEEDRTALQAQIQVKYGERPVESLAQRSTVIPICVDTSATPPVPPVSRPYRVTHIGTMYWPPNVEGILWFLQNAWPGIRARVPHARLTLIGKNPPQALRQLDERGDVDVPGYVEDLEPYLAETAVFVVPLHAAGGMRVKIVDAWCWGQPVVSTQIGAEGIEVRDGENILIADEPERFSQAVVSLLRDMDLQHRMRDSGRSWVEERYDWRQRYGAWDKVYDLLVGE